MNRFVQLLFVYMLLFPFMGLGQQQLQHKKTKFQTEDGRIFWNAELPVFISLSTDKDGKDKVRLKNTKSGKTENDSLFFTGHGKHYIKRPTINPNKWREEAFGIQVDGKAPRSDIGLDNAPKFIKGTTTYYGKGLTGTLTSVDQDAMSGVDRILFSIDAAAYSDYTTVLQLNTEKEYDLKYYAVDKVGNVEVPRNELFTVDLTFPTVNHDLSVDLLKAQNILSPRSKIELLTEDPISGVKKTSYQFDASTYRTYTTKVSVASLSDGEHTFYYKAIDNVENESEEKSYTFYLDKTVPVITPKIEGDKHDANGLTYISERSKVRLDTSDNKAGVKQVFYLIDGVGLTEYSEAFQVDKRQGRHRISYYGIDKVENKGAPKTNKEMNSLYLDLTKPTIKDDFLGQQFITRDTTFINDQTKVRLRATEGPGQSGVKEIDYVLDGKEKVTYEEAFTVEDEGVHKIEYVGRDNVNNEDEANFYFVVDKKGPEIIDIFSTRSLGQHTENGVTVDKFPTHNRIFLAASDEVVGAKTIYYSLDGATERVYTTPIVTNKKGMHELKIRAVDNVQNKTETTIKFYIE